MYEVHADRLGLIELSDTKAATNFQELKDFHLSAHCQLLNVENRPIAI